MLREAAGQGGMILEHIDDGQVGAAETADGSVEKADLEAAEAAVASALYDEARRATKDIGGESRR